MTLHATIDAHHHSLALGIQFVTLRIPVARKMPFAVGESVTVIYEPKPNANRGERPVKGEG